MIILASVVLGFWCLTLVQAIVNILTAPRLRDAEPPAGGALLVSVVIPARNEERSIGRTVEALLGQTWPSLEVIVVDDQSEDATARIVSAIAARDDRVRLLSGSDRPEGWLGKPWALEQGGRAAKGEWILFVDADVTFEPGAIAAMTGEMERHPDVRMLFAMPQAITSGFWENVLMPALPSALYLVVPMWLSNRTRIPAFAIGGGAGNLVRADAWRAIGGHERLRNAVVDDVGLARMLRRFGFRTRLVLAERHASLRMYHGLAEIVDGFTKNMYPLFAGSLVMAVVFAIGLSIVHLVPWLFALGGLAGLVEGTAQVIAWTTLGTIVAIRLVVYRILGFSAAAAVLLHPLEVLLALFIFVRSTWIVGVRRTPRWRGRSYPERITTFGELP